MLEEDPKYQWNSAPKWWPKNSPKLPCKTVPKNFTKNTQQTQLNNPPKLPKKLCSQEIQRDEMNSVNIIEGGGVFK